MVRVMMATMTTVLLIGCNSITAQGYQAGTSTNNIGNIVYNTISNVTDSM